MESLDPRIPNSSYAMMIMMMIMMMMIFDVSSGKTTHLDDQSYIVYKREKKG